MHKGTIAIELLHHVEGLIHLGEKRANILAVINSALLVAYTSGQYKIIPPNSSYIITVWPVAFSAAALVLAIWALSPQLHSTNFVPSNKLEQRLYFGAITAFQNEAELRDYFQKQNDEEIIADIMNAVHYRSKKAKSKFTCLALGTWFTLIQFIPTVFLFATQKLPSSVN